MTPAVVFANPLSSMKPTHSGASSVLWLSAFTGMDGLMTSNCMEMEAKDWLLVRPSMRQTKFERCRLWRRFSLMDEGLKRGRGLRLRALAVTAMMKRAESLIVRERESSRER